jgi:hypothetical protein
MPDRVLCPKCHGQRSIFCPGCHGNDVTRIIDLTAVLKNLARRGSGCLFGGSDCLLHFANSTTNITAALAGSVTFFTVAGCNTRDQLSIVEGKPK